MHSCGFFSYFQNILFLIIFLTDENILTIEDKIGVIEWL